MNRRVVITNRQHDMRLPRRLIVRGVRLALAKRRAGEVSAAVVDDRQIRRLNRVFLGKNRPTDVLAFPLEEPDLLGEIVISAETARREARARGLPPTHELVLYAVHGALHLAGGRDKTEREARRMRIAERAVLEQLGIERDMW